MNNNKVSSYFRLYKVQEYDVNIIKISSLVFVLEALILGTFFFKCLNQQEMLPCFAGYCLLHRYFIA